jgi:hypothetical protein
MASLPGRGKSRTRGFPFGAEQAVLQPLVLDVADYVLCGEGRTAATWFALLGSTLGERRGISIIGLPDTISLLLPQRNPQRKMRVSDR